MPQASVRASNKLCKMNLTKKTSISNTSGLSRQSFKLKSTCSRTHTLKIWASYEKINELKHWSVHVDSSEAKLTFIDEKNDGNVGSTLPTGLAMPTEVMIYRTAGRAMRMPLAL